MTTNDSSEAAILRAVQGLDEKLSRALTRQTDVLTRSIQQLADRHNDALLEQEKRNATFAARDRVEAIAEHLHDAANHIQTLTLRTGTTESSVAALQVSIASAGVTEKRLQTAEGAIVALQAQRSIRLRDRVALIGGVGGPGAVIVAVVIGHFWR